MSIFTDDFQRANGAIGGNWATTSGTLGITGGYAGSSSDRGGYNTSLSDSDRIKSIVHVARTPNATSLDGPSVKMGDVSYSQYICYVVLITGTYYFRLGQRNTGGSTTYQSVSLGTTFPPYYKMSLEWNQGHLTAILNDSVTLEDDNSDLASQPYAGFYVPANAYTINDITIITGSDPTLAVSPTVIGNYGACTEVTLTGTNTTWTSGTPGSPTFTVNHGTITAQTVVDESHATLTYCPGDYLGAVIFTDPSTNATVGALVTSDPTVAPPPSGGYSLSPEAIAWIEAQAEHGGLVLADNDTTEGEVEGISIKGAFGELLIGKRKAVGESPYPDYLTAVLADIYARLWGGEEWQSASFAASGTNAVKTDLLAVLAVLSLAKTGGTYDVGSLARELSGFPGGSHQDILDAVAAIEGGDNQEVLDAIAAMQGDPLATIKATLDLVYALGTTNSYDLDDVKSWIEAVRGTNQPTIKDVRDDIANLAQSMYTYYNTLLNAIVTGDTIQGIIDVAVSVLSGAEGATIDGVLTAIDNLANNMPTPNLLAAPVWPGLAGVTLGEELTLADDLELQGPMHGLLFTITDQPEQPQRYLFGTVASWSRVGQVIFCTDRGDYERSQTFALDTQVLAPMTMTEAASAVIRLNAGWGGTVRTWTRTP